MRMRRTHYLLWYVAISLLGTVISSVSAQSALLGLLILAGGHIFIATKRLKDMNANPWWAVCSILPLVGFILAFPKGTEGANQYGEDPRPAKAMPTSKIKYKE